MVATALPGKVKADDENLMDEIAENESNKPRDSGCCKKGLCLQLLILLVSAFLLAIFLLMLSSQIFALNYALNNVDVEVDISFRTPKNVTFPAITVCNNNPIQKTKFCKKYPEFCEQPTDSNPNYGPVIKSKDLNRFMSNLSSTDSIPLGQGWKDFAKTCLRIHHNREGHMECKHVTNIYWSLHYQNCFTFLRGEDKLTGDYRKAAFWMLLDFQPEENMVNETVVGGQLFIHDPDTRIPEGFPISSYTLKPGKMYRFRLTQTNYYRLPYPYKSTARCRYYDEDPAVSSEEECYNKCLYDKFMSSCGCMPEVIPFFDAEHSTSYCKSDNASRNCEKTERQKIEELCDEMCPIKCTKRAYRVKVDELEVPNFNKDIEDTRKNLANVWIKFETNEQLTYTDIPSLTMHADLRIYISCLYAFVAMLLVLAVIRSLTKMYGICKSGSRKN